MKVYVAVLNVCGSVSVKGVAFTEAAIIALCEQLSRRTNLTVKLKDKPNEWWPIASDAQDQLLWYELTDVADTALDAMVSQ